MLAHGNLGFFQRVRHGASGHGDQGAHAVGVDLHVESAGDFNGGGTLAVLRGLHHVVLTQCHAGGFQHIVGILVEGEDHLAGIAVHYRDGVSVHCDHSHHGGGHHSESGGGKQAAAQCAHQCRGHAVYGFHR